MSALGDRMTAIAQALATKYPTRVVTRDAKDPAEHSQADMEKGIYTLLSMREQEFTNVPGYIAQDGRQGILLVADIEHTDKNCTGSQVEDLELTLVDEVKAFLRALPESLCQLDLIAWAQSGQLFKPRGWVIFELRYVP